MQPSPQYESHGDPSLTEQVSREDALTIASVGPQTYNGVLRCLGTHRLYDKASTPAMFTSTSHSAPASAHEEADRPRTTSRSAFAPTSPMRATESGSERAGGPSTHMPEGDIDLPELAALSLTSEREDEADS